MEFVGKECFAIFNEATYRFETAGFNNGMANQGSASTIVMRYALRGGCGQQRGCWVLELFF